MKNISMIAMIGNSIDGCSYYRGAMPLSQLRKQFCPGLRVAFMEELVWSMACQADVVYMTRPHTTEYVKAAQVAKQLGVPVWIDFDDDFFSLSWDNPALRVAVRVNASENVRKALAFADVVTVSTPFLADRLKSEVAGLDVRVIPNALPLGTLPEWTLAGADDLVLWRGGATHAKDILTYRIAINDVSAAFPKTRFAYIGAPPWPIDMDRQNVAWIPDMPTQDMFATMKKLRPKVMQVPLWGSRFNRSKSNIAALEGLWAGAVPVVPNWPEWQVPGAIHYDMDMSGSYLTALLQGIKLTPSEQKERQEAGYSWLLENCDLRRVNVMRKEILEELVGT